MTPNKYMYVYIISFLVLKLNIYPFLDSMVKERFHKMISLCCVRNNISKFLIHFLAAYSSSFTCRYSGYTRNISLWCIMNSILHKAQVPSIYFPLWPSNSISLSLRLKLIEVFTFFLQNLSLFIGLV